jgi:hypothetical protein
MDKEKLCAHFAYKDSINTGSEISGQRDNGWIKRSSNEENWK